MRKKLKKAGTFSSPSGQEKPLKAPKKGPSAPDSDELWKAVLELGGDKNDLKLIGEAEDDGVDEETVEFTPESEKELKALINQLGLRKISPMSEGERQVQEVSSAAPEEGAQTSKVEEEDKKVDLTENCFHFVKSLPDRTRCVVKSGVKWYELLLGADADGDAAPVSDYWVTKLEKYAASVLELEAGNFKKTNFQSHGKGKRQGSSDMAYLQTVLKSGTLSDKVSAHVVLLQESPVHNLAALEALVAMVSLKSRRPCMIAIDALKDLFVSYLLAPERPLLTFAEHPFGRLAALSGGNKDTRDRYLAVWMFEHRLKEIYGRFLAALLEVSKDSIEKSRTKTTQTAADLLAANPEREQELLERIVNKLGDPSRSVASKAMHNLCTVLEEHSAMKEVVLREVERLLYRPNVSPKAQYYGICFLSQILLERDEGDLAARLIRIYFSFFRANVKKGDVDSKLMSALLVGVNRAFPFAKAEQKEGGRLLEEQLKVVFRLSHLSSFNTSVQALMLAYQITDCSSGAANDRFYSALYRKLLHPGLASSSKTAIFLNLVFKAMKNDPSTDRIRAFVKRLLQACLYLPSAVACGILFLVSEVARLRKDLGSLESQLVGTPTSSNSLDMFDEDEDEHYEDVQDEEETVEELPDQINIDEREEQPSADGEGCKIRQNVRPSWVHSKNLRHGSGGSSKKPTLLDYNHISRNPVFSGAGHSALWELSLLSYHVHPSAQLFATSLGEAKSIKYTGDPLRDFTLPQFLDRFVFRNPKKDPTKGKGMSVLSRRGQYRPSGIRSLAPDSKEYLALEETKIPVEERFIHRYLKDKRSKMPEEQASDAESVTSEDFNAFMDDLPGKSDADLDDLDEEDEDDFDFTSGDTGGNGEDSDESEEPELEGESENANLEDLDNIGSEGDSDDFDEEAFANSDNDEDFGASGAKKRKGGGPDFTDTKKARRGDSSDLQNLLASAEEFADLVDEAAADDVDLGGTDAMSNVKDKAGKKQMMWEKNRGAEKKFSKRKGFGVSGRKRTMKRKMR